MDRIWWHQECTAAPSPPALATAIASEAGQALAIGAIKIGTRRVCFSQNAVARATAGCCDMPLQTKEVIPTVIHLSTLVEVRALLDHHLPAQTRNNGTTFCEVRGTAVFAPNGPGLKVPPGVFAYPNGFDY